MKEITIQISDSHYDALRDAAHARGSSVTEVATSAVVTVARTAQRPLARVVAELHAQDLTVSEIGASVGIPNIRVRETLKSIHLSPNPRKPAPKPFNPRSRSKA